MLAKLRLARQDTFPVCIKRKCHVQAGEWAATGNRQIDRRLAFDVEQVGDDAVLRFGQRQV